MSHSDSTLQSLLAYAEADPNIRAVLLEGSRAFGMVDEYSDYDIVYVTCSSTPYLNCAILPFLTETFGEIAVLQTPDNGNPLDVYTHLVQFQSGLRIDLTFNSLDFLGRTPLESATVVLMDRDARFADIPPPGDSDFWMKIPDAETFRRHCNEFWWVAPYVSKAVARGQLVHAQEIFGQYVRPQYQWMLGHLAGARNDWQQVSIGKHGTHIRRLVKPEDARFCDALEESYVTTESYTIRAALDTLMTAFQSLARQVSEAIGHPYDVAEGERVMAFIAARF